MKRIQYHRYGGPGVLALEELEPGAPGRGEVLVTIAAAASPLDAGVRRGWMRLLTGRRFPRGYGHDFAGVAAAAMRMLTPGGRFADIHPAPLKMLRGRLPGRSRVLFGTGRTADMEALARAAASGEMSFPVARTVPLDGAIAALTELETRGTPEGGRLVVTMR